MRRPNADLETVERVAALAAAGHSSTEIAARTGIPDRTVRHWSNRPDVAARITEMREQMLHELSEEMLNMIRDPDAGPLHKRLKPVELATVYGIVSDKHARAQEPTPAPPQLTIVIPGYQPQQPAPLPNTTPDPPTIEGHAVDKEVSN